MARRGRRDPRHRAREAALQMLYQWHVGGGSVHEVADVYWAQQVAPVPPDVRAAADRLVRGVAEHLEELDREIAEQAEHWRLERMALVDRLILRLALYELLFVPETPAAVTISEALALTKTFSSDDAVGFVNGVLDALKRRLRPDAGN